MTFVGGLAAAVRSRLRLIFACALIGVLAGLAWGLADQPQYAATATVIVLDRGEQAEQLGNGAVGGGGSAAIDRLLELARSADVSELAAASLGGDVPGAELLSQTEFRGGDRGGSLVIRSTAGFPDYAAATANAYAGAIVEQAGALEKRRLRRAVERFEDALAEVDPASEQGIELAAKLDAAKTLAAAGDPLELGREAELPAEPESDRSALTSALAGAGLGGLFAILVVAASELRRRPVRTLAQLAQLTGAEPLGGLGPDDAVEPGRAAGTLELEPVAADRAAAVASRLALDTQNRPQTLTIASPMPDEGRTSVALGLAAAAARAGTTVLVVEADMRRPALRTLLGLEPGPGLSDYLAGAASPREVITQVPIVAAGTRPGRVQPSLVCVSAGMITDAPGAMLAGARFRTLIDQLRRVYDCVIFDAPALLPAPEGILISEATDETLLVARAGLTGRGELSQALSMLAGVRVAGSVLTAVVDSGSGARRLPMPPGARFAGPRSRR